MPAASAAPQQIGEPWVAICPPVIGGADVALTLDSAGATLEIKAMAARAPEIRARLRRVAAALSPVIASTAAEGEQGHGVGITAAVVLPPLTAAVLDVDNGARLVMVAASPTESKALVAGLTTLLDRMRTGACPALPPPLERARPVEQARPAESGPPPPSHHHH